MRNGVGLRSCRPSRYAWHPTGARVGEVAGLGWPLALACWHGRVAL